MLYYQMHAVLSLKLENKPFTKIEERSILALEVLQFLCFLFAILHPKTVQELSPSFLLGLMGEVSRKVPSITNNRMPSSFSPVFLTPFDFFYLSP